MTMAQPESGAHPCGRCWYSDCESFSMGEDQIPEVGVGSFIIRGRDKSELGR